MKTFTYSKTFNNHKNYSYLNISSINNLISGLNNIKFTDKLFRESYLIRLNHLKSLKKLNLIDENLFLKF